MRFSVSFRFFGLRMPAGISKNSCNTAPIAGVLTLGLLSAVAFAHFSGATRGESNAHDANSRFSASTAAVHAQRDLLLQEEDVFEAERRRFERPSSSVPSQSADWSGLVAQLEARRAAGQAAHEEALHASVTPRVISLAAMLQDLRAIITAAAPRNSAVRGGAAGPLAPSGGGFALFAPLSTPQARNAHARRSVIARRGATPSGPALQNYYSIRNGYAGRTVKKLYLFSPPASVRRLFIAPSSSGFLTLLDFTTAHAYAPEFPV